MKIVDASNMILGRMATQVAKELLLGENIVIVNAEKAVITGDKDKVFAKFKQRRERGIPLKGPYYPKRADLIVRRMIRGMLPYKQDKGDSALKRLRCYISVPEEFQGKDFSSYEKADVSKSNAYSYTEIDTISRLLGAKQ